MNEDNPEATAIAKFVNLRKKSKYIEVHYHFVNKCYENKIIEILQVDSNNNVADVLTKALGRVKFEILRNVLKMI